MFVYKKCKNLKYEYCETLILKPLSATITFSGMSFLVVIWLKHNYVDSSVILMHFWKNIIYFKIMQANIF